MNYATTEKELLAVVFALDKFRSYLVGAKIIIYTDHAFFVAVQILNWVLQRDNMTVAGTVDQINHAGQRSGLRLLA